MAIAQPTTFMVEYGQDASWTVSLNPEEDVTGWAVSTTVRPYNGGTALVTKTTASDLEIDVSNESTGVFITYFSAADLSLLYGPGAYVIQMHRTNSGYTYPITDPSPLILRPADSTTYPTITNLGEYAAHALLGVTLTDAMAEQIIQLLFSAEQQLKNFCQRDFVYRASQTEYYAGTGTQDLILSRTPVWSIASIYEDWNGNGGTTSGAFANNTVLSQGVDYYMPLTQKFGESASHSGIVKRIGSVWPYQRFRPHDTLASQIQPLPGCLKVTYTGGYRLMPHDLKQAVWNLVTFNDQQSGYGVIPISESGEGYSRSLGNVDESGMPSSVRLLLAPYRDGISLFR